MRRMILVISVLLMGACFAAHGGSPVLGSTLRLGMNQRQVCKLLGGKGIDPLRNEHRYEWKERDNTHLVVNVAGKNISLREKGLGTDPTTRAKYQKVTEGMAYDDVVKLLGKPGKRVFLPPPTEFYWTNARGEMVHAGFSMGRLTFIRFDKPYTPPVTRVKVTRAQSGLLKNGMSYQQVVAKLGCSGVDEMHGLQSYEWRTPKKEQISIALTDGIVTSISATSSCDFQRYKFDRIGVGMTLAEVRKILGNGKLTDAPDPCYSWSNADGGHLYATFKGGKLIRTFYQTK